MLSVDIRTTTMTTILLWIVVATTLLPYTDGAAWNSWFGDSNSNTYTASEEAVSLQKLENYWLDAMDVVTELGSYETLWIKPHSCVWSECAVGTSVSCLVIITCINITCLFPRSFMTEPAIQCPTNVRSPFLSLSLPLFLSHNNLHTVFY